MTYYSESDPEMIYLGWPIYEWVPKADHERWLAPSPLLYDSACDRCREGRGDHRDH